MASIRRLVRRVVALFASSRAEADLSREIRSHLQLLEDEFVSQGMSAADARDAARRAFGGIEQVKERHRDARAFGSIDAWWLDLTLGVRMMVKSPGLAIVGGIGMAVAIAIGATFFTMTYSYVQPDVPLEDGDRLVALENWDTAANRQEPRSLADFASWRAELNTVTDLGAFRTVTHNLIVPGGPSETVAIAEMTASGFRTARVPPAMGRYLTEDDERKGAPPVVVLGREIWRTRFAFDRSVVGRSVRLGKTQHTIVGVMPEGFGFPVNHRLWVPLQADPRDYARREGPSISIFGRLAAGATLDEARAELTAIGKRAAASFPQTHARLRPRILSYTSLYFIVVAGDVARWQLHLAQLFVSMLLVLVGANVAVLTYARTANRQGEIAIRSALGASRRRIIGQLFVEAFVLSAAAGVLGLFISAAALERLTALLTQDAALPFWIRPGISGATVVYVLGLAVIAAVIAGIVPAIQATGRRVQLSVQRLSTGGSGLRLGATWTVLIVLQVAVAVAVLPGTMFAAWTWIRDATVAPGFAAHEYLTARLEMDRDLAPSGAASADEQEFVARFSDRLAELVRRLEAEPAVSDVTFGSAVPGEEPAARIEIDGPSPSPGSGSPRSTRMLHVEAGFFDTFDATVVAGRRFRTGAADEVVVNRSFVRTMLGDGQVLGRRVRLGERARNVGDKLGWRPKVLEQDRWYQIVGVVTDFPATAPGNEEPRLYQAASSRPLKTAAIAMHVRVGPAAGFAPRLREIATTLDPTLRLEDVLSLDEVYRGGERGLMRVGAVTLALVMVSVLLLSAAGIHALMSFAVTKRRREIGIRVALGAERHRILRSIFSRALGQLAVGVIAGILAATVFDSMSEGEMLGGEGAILLPAVSLLMIVVGLFAAWTPARRGLRINPTEALRAE